MTKWYTSPSGSGLFSSPRQKPHGESPGQKVVGQDRTLIEKMSSLVKSLSPKNSKRSKFMLVDELPHLPTVALDLDATLVHTLVDPVEIAVAQQSDLRTIRLPGNMGLVVERPGIEQLFSCLTGYNVMVFSAGGPFYVKTVIETLAEENLFLRGKLCKILSGSDLTLYSELSELTIAPCAKSLNTEGVCYVKDLRKARGDGDSRMVLIVDDNPYAFQVQPHMKDDDFKRRYDFTLNAVPVPLFIATDSEAVSDTVLALVGRLLQTIVGAEDTLAALKDHPDLSELKGMCHHVLCPPEEAPRCVSPEFRQTSEFHCTEFSI